MTAAFKNAQLLAHLYPDTFEVPTQERLDSVGPGSGVRICAVDAAGPNVQDADGERFWVYVLERHGDQLVGRIDNHLVATDEHGLSFGDHVMFAIDNVYDIFDGEIEES